MQRMYAVLTALCLTFVVAALTPAATLADCPDGWTFVNDGPCAVEITVTPDGTCVGAQTTFRVRAHDRIHVDEVCCITAVKIQVIGPCTGTDILPVRCLVGQTCPMPSPFTSVTVEECKVSID